MNEFLKDLKKELKKLSINDKEINEIIEDHKEMIESAQNDGLDEFQIEKKFGNPKNVAKEIYNDNNEIASNVSFNQESIESCVKERKEDYDYIKGFPVVSNSYAINVGLFSVDLDITTYDGEEIQIYKKNIKDINEYEIKYTNEEFILKRKKSLFKIFGATRKKSQFLVFIPNNYKIRTFNYNSISGNANINGISTEKLIIKSTSGDVEMTNMDSDDFKVSTVSGDLELTGFKGNSFEISSVSGDIEIESGIIDGKMYFHSVSGDIDLEYIVCNDATFKTVSGNLVGKECYPNEISLKSVSGDINIENSDKSREVIVLSQKSVSGNIRIS